MSGSIRSSWQRVALVLLLLPFRCAGDGSGAADRWPDFRVAPAPIEAVPEMLSPAAAAGQDSLRAVLRTFLHEGDLPPPPPRPDTLLIEWLIAALSFGDPVEISSLGQSVPTSWSAADPEGRLALACALALQEIGKPEDACWWLEEGRIAEADRPYAMLLRIELEDVMGDSAGAAAIAQEIRAAHPRADWTIPAGIRLLRARERAGDAAGLLEESLRFRRELGPDAEEVASRVRALRALGRPGAARATADTLFDAHPWTRTARVEALERLGQWGRAIPREEARRIFPVLLRHQRFAEAESLLVRLPSSDSLRVGYLEALLAARLPAAVLRDPLEPGAVANRALKARLLLVKGRAARNTLLWASMTRYYAMAAGLDGETRSTALLEWAREAESHQREETADSLYTLLLAVPAQADEARFRRALTRIARGRTREALDDLRSGDDRASRNGGYFWRARLAKEVGDTAEAGAALRELAERDGYYAARARAEIAWRRARGPGADFWSGERERAFHSSGVGSIEGRASCRDAEAWGRHAAGIRLLRRFGRNAWAEREQRRLELALPVEDRARLLLCLGLPDLAVRVAIAHSSEDPLLRYPRAYARQMAQAAERAGVATELVWALARRESLFHPGALSGAGALGVLQLMESTAAATATRWGIPSRPLTRADVNIPLGIFHFADLGREEDWHLPALLAAYNAGATKTAEWVARFPDPDFFIERIGWRETRDYVRHALEGCWTYREAYGLGLASSRPDGSGSGSRRGGGG